MTSERISQTHDTSSKGLGMYFSREIAEKFAELEQNEKNFRVAQIVDAILIQEAADLNMPIYSAELGGGAHPDRYNDFFSKLIKERGHMDWIDISPIMLELAERYISFEKYQKRRDVITFIKSEILEYLRGLENEKLDLTIMKYTIDHIGKPDELFKLLAAKLKRGGKLIATIGLISPKLKSFSTNARYLYNGDQFPDDETRTLKDGDSFTVKFFKESGNPNSGYLEGAESLKYFHSAEKIKQMAEVFGFDFFLGDWKNFVLPENQKGETINQDVLVLTKK